MLPPPEGYERRMATTAVCVRVRARLCALVRQPALRLFTSLVTQLEFVELIVYQELHGRHAGFEVPVAGDEFLRERGGLCLC